MKTIARIGILLMLGVVPYSLGQTPDEFRAFSDVEWNKWGPKGTNTEATATVTDQAISSLSLLLSDTNKLITFHAARALRKCGPRAKDALPALRRALHNTYVCARISCMGAIVNIGLPATNALPDVAANLLEPNIFIQATAIDALRRFGKEAKPFLPQLKTLLRSKDETIRQAAKDAINEIDTGP